jgi:hypothetical protein
MSQAGHQRLARILKVLKNLAVGKIATLFSSWFLLLNFLLRNQMDNMAGSLISFLEALPNSAIVTLSK